MPRRRSVVHLAHEMKFDIARMIVDAAETAVGQSDDILKALAYVFESPRRDRGERHELFLSIGEEAQEAVLDAYDIYVTRTQSPASRTAYRAGATDNHRLRFAGRVLYGAIAHPEFFDAHPDGIRFINITHLDRRAAHWRRLSFGAAPAGQGIQESFPLRFGSLVAGAIGLSGPPSPGFDLPPGSFLTPDFERTVPHSSQARGEHPFFPRPELAGRRLRGGRRATRGIVGRPFLQAGVRTIADFTPVAVREYYASVYERALSRRGPLGRRRMAYRPQPGPFR